MKGSRQSAKSSEVRKGVISHSKKAKTVKVVDVKLNAGKNGLAKQKKKDSPKSAKEQTKKMSGQLRTRSDAKTKTVGASRTLKVSRDAQKKQSDKAKRAKSSPSSAADKSTSRSAVSRAGSIVSRERAPNTKVQTEPKRQRKTLSIVACEAQQNPAPVVITTPSLALLKPFRDAAKRNRQLLKEKSAVIKKQRASFLAKPSKRGKTYTLDLRIHSAASAGFFSTGGVDPAPALVRLAKVKGVHIVGLTDWYNAAAIDKVKELSLKSDVTIIPGVDLRCRISDCDEVSLVALFPESYSSGDVFQVLSKLRVPEWAHGRWDYCINLPFREVVNTIENSGGVIIPSRVDKTPFRSLAIPAMVEEYGFHAFDLVHAESPELFRKHWPSGGFTFFTFSNAHALAQIGSRTSKVKLSLPGFAGIKELVQRRSA